MSTLSVSASSGRFRVVILVLILIMGLGFTLTHGITDRQEHLSRLGEWNRQVALPAVAVIHPVSRSGSGTLELPGHLEAFTEAPLHARVSGYLKSWTADIGSRVKAGQLLAEIETPELDQQLLQARADLATAEAEANLAAATAKRWKSLLGTDAISRQEAEEKIGTAAVKLAVAQSARANLERYTALRNFARIQAPFDGRITARHTDLGALIAVGTGSSPLFVISDTRKLRVHVGVPQVFLPEIQADGPVELTAPEYPDKVFQARVMASSGAVDPASGTGLVQLEVDNPADQLLPGGYVQVRLSRVNRGPALNIPVSALIVDGTGIHVAVVDANSTVHLQPVTVLRDLGNRVEISGDLTVEASLLESPPDGIAEADVVRIVTVGQNSQGGQARRND